MRRKLLCSSIITLCSVIVAFFASVTSSSAYSMSPLCNYRITVTDDVGCIPYLTTSWSNGAQDFQGLSAVSNFQFRIPGTWFNCDPYPDPNPPVTLDWFSLDGGATQITPANSPQLINVNGCCMVVSATVDASGYTLIIISPCATRVQNPGHCNYRVIVTSDVGCPISLTTGWSNGAQDVQSSLQSFNIYQFPIPAPQGCPLAPSFDWCSLDGGVTQIPLGGLPQPVVVNGCCLRLSATVGSNYGDILIIISPC